MRTLVLIIGLLLATTASAAKDHVVRGHVKKDGTYVAPSRATNPNRTQRDFWQHYSSSPVACGLGRRRMLVLLISAVTTRQS